MRDIFRIESFSIDLVVTKTQVSTPHNWTVKRNLFSFDLLPHASLKSALFTPTGKI